MSAAMPSHVSASGTSHRGPGSLFHALEPPSSSDSPWLTTLIFNARAIAAAAESLPFPYVKGLFGTAAFLLETVEKVQRNRDSMRELCADVVDIINVIRDRITSHRDTAALQFKAQCEELDQILQNAVEVLHHHQREPRGFSTRIKELVKSTSTTEEITRVRNRVREIRLNFMMPRSTVLPAHSSALPVHQAPNKINNCPRPTRIFHGRRAILDKMHQYFAQNVGKQNIFLLHGLGGAGKTQIVLKFVHELATYFTNIFLVDASTAETIDAGLKNIATITGIGDLSKDALQWLESKEEGWLLFFDNADDPKVNLNNFFPQCSHGNIIITSRNPGLCVYAGGHCVVSDMEEQEAVDLLIRSAAEDTTDHKKETAAQIVRVLHYLPLAIIQAGAFIAKTGNLDSYLALYAHNRSRLLNEGPAQLHDNYAWTVYTTWQISFDQLSAKAKIFLQLCSFLHYQDISEDLFKHAVKYTVKPYGPSNEELELPLKVLAMFLGPSGVWDPLHFIDVTSEIRAYSLISLDSEKNMLSIHPLVHDWTRSTLSDDTYHSCMLVITGMALAGLSDEEMMLASPWMLHHIEFLMKGNLNGIPDFRLEYGTVYLFAGKPEKALEFTLGVHEQRRNVLGENHPDTLAAMYGLVWTYKDLGKFKEAEELGLAVLEKRRHVLGDHHTDTITMMASLACTYRNLGKLKEAEELELDLLANSRHIMGDNHPDTLRSMGNLAWGYKSLGKAKEAEQLELIVLEKRRASLGENHPATLVALESLSATYMKLERLHEAEGLQVVVLEKWANILGDNHQRTLISAGNLASTYKAMGKLHMAENLEVTVLEKRKNMLGDNHPHTLIAMANLARTYNKLGRFREAEELEEVVLEKRRNILGASHPATLHTMSNLGWTFNKLERWQEAEDLLVLALKNQTEILGEHHLHTLDTMQNLIVTYTKLGKLEEAEELKRALHKSQV
ncbi:hypothetical protein FB451DRAFT_1370716 [Mycena latifolia]|nr:hypothetical protein FB451DRAFT_1370716 [Mycena latifolia]